MNSGIARFGKLVFGDGRASDRKHRLRRSFGQRAQACALAAHQQDRLSHGFQATAATLADVPLHHADPYSALIERVRRVGPSPAVTFYDGSERIELSYKSLDNWVAKTANFLTDEIEVNGQDTFYLDLPAHWLKVVWLLAIWACGCRVVSTRDKASYTISNKPIEGDDIYCSLQVMGKLPDAPAGFIDFITEVRRCGDFFAPTNATTQLDCDERWRVPELSRILIASPDFSPEQIAAALSNKASLVIVRNADEAQKASIARDEKVTCNWE
jgi:uncharacterized protein (TIGR03089 family)